MAEQIDPYKVLGVSKDASDADIKKAYRHLSKKYHPDLNHEAGAEEKFKQVNDAYDILKDPQKKAQYDQFGSTGGQGFGGAGGYGNAGGFDGFGGFGDMGDIFSSFFGGGRTQSRTAPPPASCRRPPYGRGRTGGPGPGSGARRADTTACSEERRGTRSPGGARRSPQSRPRPCSCGRGRAAPAVSHLPFPSHPFTQSFREDLDASY